MWLDSSPALDPVLAGSLCRRHADALTVPRGWRIEDRREAVPRLFRVDDREDANTREHTPSGGVRKRSPKDTTQVSLFDAPERDVDAVEPQPAIEETRAIPWMPRLIMRGDNVPEESPGEESDMDPTVPDATPAQGRLLRRAFGDRNVR